MAIRATDVLKKSLKITGAKYMMALIPVNCWKDVIATLKRRSNKQAARRRKEEKQ